MSTILGVEWIKLRSTRFFWILAGIYLLLLSAVSFGLSSFFSNLGGPMNMAADLIYHPNDIWQNIAYLAAWFKIILAFIVILSMAQEFSYKTIRQHVIDGWRRSDLLLSKIALIALLSVLAGVSLFIVTLAVLVSNNEVIDWGQAFAKAYFVPAYALQVFGYLSFALMIATLLRRTGIAMAGLMLYTMPIELILAWRLPDSVSELLPLNVLDNLIHMPFSKYMLKAVQDYVSGPEVGMAVLYTGLFLGITYLLLWKRDLK